MLPMASSLCIMLPMASSSALRRRRTRITAARWACRHSAALLGKFRESFQGADGEVLVHKKARITGDFGDVPAEVSRCLNPLAAPLLPLGCRQIENLLAILCDTEVVVEREDPGSGVFIQDDALVDDASAMGTDPNRAQSGVETFPFSMEDDGNYDGDDGDFMPCVSGTLRAEAPEYIPNDEFAAESKLRAELRNEAAGVIQRWWRNIGCISPSTAGSSTDASDDDDVNSLENLAVFRAFLASVNVDQPCRTNSDAHGNGEAQWTIEQVSLWLDGALSLARGATEQAAGARTFWREWSAIETFFPQQLRKGTIQLFDMRLQSIGFPSLRELVRLRGLSLL